MDEITNAILTNPELLERVQGRDVRVLDVYINGVGVEMVAFEAGKDIYCVSKDKIFNYDDQPR